jgi:argonaute-like protein implicated in RNA metabolism and viral defense
MSRDYKILSRDDLHRSFLVYKNNIDQEYKAGRLTRNEAARLLASARENYKKQNYNKMVDRINAA